MLKVKTIALRHLPLFTGLALFSHLAMAEADFTSTIISIGEHHEIPLPPKSRLAIGNKDIIHTRPLPQKQALIIKGKKMGHTEIIIWPPHAPPKAEGRKHHIFVVSKREQLKIGQLLIFFKQLGLQVGTNGPPFIVSGEISNMTAYLQLIKLLQHHKSELHVDILVHDDLKRRLLGLVYHHLLNEFVDSLECHFESWRLDCTYAQEDSPSKPLLELVSEQTGASFRATNTPHATNYVARLKIIQIEASSLEDVNWGLSEVKASWSEWFSRSPIEYFKAKSFNLAKRNIEFRVLAEPEITLRLGHPIKIQVGQENSINIPDSTLNRGGVEFKFSGLDLEMIAKKRGGHIEIEFQTRLTRPEGEGVGQISSSSEKSMALLALDHPLALFDISMEAKGTNVSSLPYLGHVPGLGRLFQGKSKATGHKKITGIIVITREDIYAKR